MTSIVTLQDKESLAPTGGHLEDFIGPTYFPLHNLLTLVIKHNCIMFGFIWQLIL